MGLRAITAATLAVGALGCGSDAASGCGPIRREALDSEYLVHVIDVDAPVEYASDPPTSGPHQPSPPVSGVVDAPIPRPIQVGILERGDVLIQHRPDLDADALEALRSLAATGVVIAPAPDLPDPVVATAWVHKRSCAEVDVDALQAFVDERLGKGVDH